MDGGTGLTYRVQELMENRYAMVLARANSLLDARRTAAEVRAFLTDPSSLSTPGFVMRRHIQRRKLIQLQKGCADLAGRGNVPWPKGAVHDAARQLSSLSLRAHGLAISTVNWERYLSDQMSQGIQRKMLFKLAFVLGMDEEETVRLLLSAGQGPYNVRDPLEFICLFCQGQREPYSWRDVQRLLEALSARIASEGEPAPSPAPSEGMTRVLRGEVDRIWQGRLPRREAEERLLTQMAASAGEFSGISLSRRRDLLRLTRYLLVLYPTYFPARPPAEWEADEEGLPPAPVPLNGEGRPNPAALLQAVYQAQSWEFSELEGEGLPEQAAPLREIYLFCKNYYSHLNGIDRAVRAPRNAQQVERRDVLLLTYFLIWGGDRAGLGRERGAEDLERLQALTRSGDPFDERMGQVLSLLADRAGLERQEERLLSSRRILNELLALFGFPALYPPAAFDRFILLSLLAGRPADLSWYVLTETGGEEEVR